MKHNRPNKTLRLISITIGILFLSGLFFAAIAAAPMAKTQVPGYYRMMLGQFEVTALADGFHDMNMELLRNAPEARIRILLERNYLDYPKVKTPVMAYLINTSASLVLVDAGAGKAMGPSFGNVIPNMKASGYDPAQVDAVLLTHMHLDHVSGLLNSEGKPAFPNALIYVSKAESDYWLSPSVAEKAPAEMKKYFKLAQDAAAPYISMGRWQTFDKGNLPIEGIKAVPIPGHTPGHCGYEVKSGRDSLIIVGDMVHSIIVQAALPDVAVSFDKDQKQAIASRKAVFKSAARTGQLIAGMHIPFPGIGRLRADGENTYTWVPIDFAPMP
ncbi:MAG TPA: MBL fold metallo-hydrolase [Syntrophales bacterium]|nr:MBL fold metallo-hydrolase [Syntrophales bacterium]